MGDNELERVARAMHDDACADDDCGGGDLGEYERQAETAIAAMTPSSQTLRRALGALHVVEEDHYGRYCKSCSTNDRRVSDPCPTHRVLREFDMGNLPEIPDSSTLNVIAEVRAKADAWDALVADHECPTSWTTLVNGSMHLDPVDHDCPRDDLNPKPTQ